ncbi:excisionase family DNA-binding protein [Oceanobacillus sp. Castelsardo]|uniref:excisionase family DNA-binding protein n=1 Tax=Oceanobacillus sp. Castelsardo TaxID=1851204 RepID=UPI0008395F60|nr:excisionase family DNA-binding protein [Oceanobacillus sp. Castelsardo]
MERRTMTVKEAAIYLGLHSDTINDMVRENKMAHQDVTLADLNYLNPGINPFNLQILDRKFS